PRPTTSTLFPYTTLFRSWIFGPANRDRQPGPRGDDLPRDHRHHGGRHHHLPVDVRAAEVHVDFQRKGVRTSAADQDVVGVVGLQDRKSTRLNSSHSQISY